MNQFIKNTAFTLLVLFIAALPAIAQDTSNSEAATQPSSQGLESLTPTQVAGWARNEVAGNDEPLGVRAIYKHKELPYSLLLTIGYGEGFERQVTSMVSEGREMEKELEQSLVEELERDGRPLYVFQMEGEAAALGLVAGDMSAMIIASCYRPTEPCSVQNTDAALDEVLALYDSLDIERLVAYYSPPVPDASAIDAPEGFSPYATFLGQAQVAFAYPENWTVIDLFRSKMNRRQVVAIRDPEVAQAGYEHFAGGVLSPAYADTTPGLVTPDNVLVSVEWLGKGLHLDRWAESMTKQAELNHPVISNPTIVQPVAETKVAGSAALFSIVRGSDTNGFPVVLRQIFFTAGPDEALYAIAILRPAEASEATLETIQVLVDSITVTPR